MFRALILTLLLLLPAVSSLAQTRVIMETSQGQVTLELEEQKAPETVKNFLKYVDSSYYDGTIFHRVIKGFMIQGGGFDADLKRKATRQPIKNEAGNGLKNDRGTIAMARTNVVDSATGQFFINLVNNDFLNHRGTSPREYGYAVFGKVVDGMKIVDRIAELQTKRENPVFQNLPVENVEIISIRRVTK